MSHQFSDRRANRRFAFTISVIFFAVILLTVLLYSNGLNSRFILDDDPNLSNLTILNSYYESEQHHQYAQTRFWLFILDGVSSEMGRPISLISFALQSHHWPDNPKAFKYVNLMIHLLNGCLVFLITLRLAKALGFEEKSCLLITLLTSIFWIIHPIHTSTVFYVVQRMTELSAFFTLFGILLYLYGRSIIDTSKNNTRGLAWMSIGVLIGLSGVLSKENAILMPLYILVIEYTLLNKLRKPVYWITWRNLFLLLPLLVFTSYLIVNFNTVILDSYTHRDFNLTDRLLTQSRIIVDYALKIIIPDSTKFGLFHDDFQISRNLFDNPTTLISILSICVLFISAIKLRKRLPILSFAILWFFAGHILESTIIGLELYFDHRNYLPSFSLIFLLSYLLIVSINYSKKSLIKLLLTISIISLISLYSYLTYSESKLWLDPHLQALVWKKNHPNSLRAKINLANTYLELGHALKARDILNNIENDYPYLTSTYAYHLFLNCLTEKDQYNPDDKEYSFYRKTKFDITTLTVVRSIIDLYRKSGCSRENIELTKKFIISILNNTEFSPQYADFHFALGRLYQYDGLLDLAMRELDQSFKLKPDVYVAMNQAQMLSSANLYDDALRYLQKAKDSIRSSKLDQKLFADVLNEWEHDIIKDKNSHQSRKDAETNNN